MAATAANARHWLRAESTHGGVDSALSQRLLLSGSSRHALFILDGDSTEEISACLADRTQRSVQAGHGHPAHTQEVDGAELDAGGVVPDVLKREACKADAPAECQGYGHDHRQTFVTAAQGGVEAFVAASPDTVDGANSLWFSKDFVEHHLVKHIQSNRCYNTRSNPNNYVRSLKLQHDSCLDELYEFSDFFVYSLKHDGVL